MKTSTSITAIAPAVVKAAAELGPVAKDAVNPAFRNRYATLDAIMESVRPVLARHGLAIIQTGTTPETVDGKLTSFGVETLLLHTSGEWIASSVTLPIEKITAQGAGSAMSYGRRYGISALLGLTAEDDDGNAASTRPTAGTAAAPATVARVAETPEPGQRLYQTVPDTPRAKPFNGSVGEAMSWKIPFKKSKHFGVPLSDLAQEDLESLHDFCRKDPDKFGDIIARVEAVLEHYFAEESNNAPVGGEDLPF